MIKIGIAGGPGSGKSSLARQLTTELYNKRNFNAQYVTEFAREHINTALMYGTFTPSLVDQLLIFYQQIGKEAIVPAKADYLISDSPVFLPIIFAYNMCNIKDYQQRMAYNELYRVFLATYTDWYNYIFVLQRQKDFRKDGTRHETAEQADEIGQQIISFLKYHKITFHYIMAESDDMRIKQALKILDVE